MPPASTTHGAKERERLHHKFSAVATALADLYRESSNSYEAGYRDALLFVQRYLQSSTPTPPPPTSQQVPATQIATSFSSSSSPPCTTVDAVQMMRFVQSTIAARRERMAAVRGVTSMRRRQREATDAHDGGSGRLSGSEGGEGDEEEEEVVGEEEAVEVEEEAGLTPQSSPASGPAQMAPATSPSATADSSHTALNHEMELITLLETPLQPHRQRRRTDRVSSTSHRRLPSPRGHPFSSQLQVGRGK